MLQNGILEQVLHRDNLNQAYKKVKKNNGAAGIDGITCDQLLEYLKENGKGIENDIRHKRYKSKPVMRVDIPKPDGGTRKLGIPTVGDRVVQQALAQVLETIYEPTFHPNSYGFRPEKSAQQAVLKSLEYINQGYNWIVDLDLEKFFDTVCQEKLISIINRRVKEGEILALIHSFLKSGVIHGDNLEETALGVPQGGNISPLCANIILNELDWELDRRGLRFVRYADDCVIMVRSEKAANRVMRTVTAFLEQHLKLKVNQEKSKIARPEEVKFLGYSYYCFFKEKQYRLRVHPKSTERLIRKLKELTKRSWGVSNRYKIQKINEVVRGWTNYFRLASMKTLARQVDKMTHYRLRMCIWKHWKNPSTRRRNLIKLGVNEANARAVASNKGYARVCRSIPVCIAISNARLQQSGLISMEQYYSKSGL